GAMVFQLPYMPFPECGPGHNLKDYELLRPYLHSTRLRWSHGAIKGRETDEWQKMVAALPAPDMLERLIASGFSGLYIDRRGYADRGAALEAALTRLLDAEPLTSASGTRVFFILTERIETTTFRE